MFIRNSVHEKSHGIRRNSAGILANSARNTEQTEVKKTDGIPCRRNSVDTLQLCTLSGREDDCGYLLVLHTGDQCLFIFRFCRHLLFNIFPYLLSTVQPHYQHFCINRRRESNRSLSLTICQHYQCTEVKCDEQDKNPQNIITKL